MLTRLDWLKMLIIPAILSIIPIIFMVFWDLLGEDEIILVSLSTSTKNDWEKDYGGWNLDTKKDSYKDVFPQNSEEGNLFYGKIRNIMPGYSPFDEPAYPLNNKETKMRWYTEDDMGYWGVQYIYGKETLKKNDLGSSYYHLSWKPNRSMFDAIDSSDKAYFTEAIIRTKNEELIVEANEHDRLWDADSLDVDWLDDKKAFYLDGHWWPKVWSKMSGNPKINFALSNTGASKAILLGYRVSVINFLDAQFGCGVGSQQLEVMNSEKMVDIGWYDSMSKEHPWSKPIVLPVGSETLIQAELGIVDLSPSNCGGGNITFSIEVMVNYGDEVEYKHLGNFYMSEDDNFLDIYWY